jgi:nitrogen fixation/metabolism regulation signal transduction histidine kinase
MRISHKLITGFVMVVIPSIVVSVFAVILMDTQIKEVGHFHTPALHLIQQSAHQTLEAVEESFAYIALGEEIERDEFLRWTQRYSLTYEQFEKVANLDQPKQKREREIFERIKSGQRELAEKAKEMFGEFESKGSVNEMTLTDYENTVDMLLTEFDEIIRIEHEDVNQSQQSAMIISANSQNLVSLVGILCLVLALGFGVFMSHRISKPISELTFATTELAKGNWDHQVAIKGKDEIGQLASSFNNMVIKLKDRTPEGAIPYGSGAEGGLRNKLNLLEKQIIKDALKRANGVKKQAAALLQIDPRNFPHLLRKHDLS